MWRPCRFRIIGRGLVRSYAKVVKPGTLVLYIHRADSSSVWYDVDTWTRGLLARIGAHSGLFCFGCRLFSLFA